MFYHISCIKRFIIFGDNHQTSILSLLPHLQDPTLNTGRKITDTDMHTLYYTDNLNPAHYNSQRSSYGIMQITLINLTKIYIHSVQATVNYRWSLIAHHSTTIIHHLYNIQTEVTVQYSAWQRPKHAPCLGACSVITVHVSTKYLYNRN